MAQSHSLSAILNGNLKENSSVVGPPAGAVGEVPNAAGSLGVSTLIQSQRFTMAATAGFTPLTATTLTNTGIFIPQNSIIVNFDVYVSTQLSGASTLSIGYNGDGTGTTFVNGMTLPTTAGTAGLLSSSALGTTVTPVTNWHNAALMALTPLAGSTLPVLQLNIKVSAGVSGDFCLMVEYAFLG